MAVPPGFMGPVPPPPMGMPMGPGMPGMPSGIPDMMGSMAALAKGRPNAKRLVEEAVSLLEKARDLDPKLEERISDALSSLRGDGEEEGAGSREYRPTGMRFER